MTFWIIKYKFIYDLKILILSSQTHKKKVLKIIFSYEIFLEAFTLFFLWPLLEAVLKAYVKPNFSLDKNGK